MLTLLALLTATQAATAAPPTAELRGEALMAALREGGYTLLVRHARTDRSRPVAETPAYSPPLRADQRNLTAEGEADVRLMARTVARYRLPIGEVLSSPIYRCRETADAFGPATITMTLRAFPTTDETAALVAAVPKPGTNRVIVTHHFVIEATVPGIKLGEIGESEVAVIRPTGPRTVELVGRITLRDWTTLAGDPTPASPAAAAHAPVAHGAPVAWPDTPVARLAQHYVAAFNTGDSTMMRGFITQYMAPVAERPTDARVAAYQALYRDHGPIMVVGLAPAGDTAIGLNAHSRQGGLQLEVTATPDGRIASVLFRALAPGRHP